MASASSVQSTAQALTSSLVAPSFATSALLAVLEISLVSLVGFGGVIGFGLSGLISLSGLFGSSANWLR
jgi:hypothetical protein